MSTNLLNRCQYFRGIETFLNRSAGYAYNLQQTDLRVRGDVKIFAQKANVLIRFLCACARDTMSCDREIDCDVKLIWRVFEEICGVKLIMYLFTLMIVNRIKLRNFNKIIQ